MQEKLKAFFSKIKDWWKSAAKKTKILIGSGVLAVLVVIGIITAINLNQPYEVLFTDMNQEELSEVASYLSDIRRREYCWAYQAARLFHRLRQQQRLLFWRVGKKGLP